MESAARIAKPNAGPLMNKVAPIRPLLAAISKKALENAGSAIVLITC